MLEIVSKFSVVEDFLQKGKVAKFREMIEADRQLVNPITDDSFLLRFLHFKKFDMQEALRCYVRYVKTRELHPTCYRNLDINEAQVFDLISRGYVFPLPEKDYQGRTVIFVRNGAFGQRFGHRATDLYRSLVMTLETLLCDESNQKNGLVYVVDFEGQYLSDVAFVGLVEPQKLARSGEKCYPAKHKEAHWVNASALVKTSFWFLISFVPEHLKKCLKLHRNMDSLKKSVSQKILPKEYGGKISWRTMADDWICILQANRTFLLSLDDMFSKERPDLMNGA